MPRLATAVSPSGDGTSNRTGSIADLTVRPYLKDGRMVELHVFTSPFSLLGFITAGRAFVNVELLPRSASYSKFFTLDQDGKSFNWFPMPGKQEASSISLDRTGVAIIDLPSSHQIFVAFEQDVPFGKRDEGLVLTNESNAPYYRHITRDIIGRLQTLGFLTSADSEPAKLLQFPKPAPA